jgi:hypothetical protein
MDRIALFNTYLLNPIKSAVSLLLYFESCFILVCRNSMTREIENSTNIFEVDHGPRSKLASQLIYPVLTGLRRTPGGC